MSSNPEQAWNFSDLIFTTVSAVFIGVKIAFIFTSLSAVQVYDLHIFTVINLLFCFEIKNLGCGNLREIYLLLWPKTKSKLTIPFNKYPETSPGSQLHLGKCAIMGTLTRTRKRLRSTAVRFGRYSLAPALRYVLLHFSEFRVDANFCHLIDNRKIKPGILQFARAEHDTKKKKINFDYLKSIVELVRRYCLP